MTQTKMYQLGLIGWPLGHSLSPLLHGAALSAAGLQGQYDLYPVENTRSCGMHLKRLIEKIRSGELNGLNVTIPHKQHVLDLVDELSPTAAAIGAVNTLFLRDGQVWGDNTDAPGFYLDLANHFSLPMDASEQKALVLGAGGSSRAVVYALAMRGWQVTVAARRLDQAEELIGDLDDAGSGMRPCELAAGSLPTDVRLIVNTTPVGMQPNADASPWPAELPFPDAACLYDLVYAPRQTLLVQSALNAGLAAANGLGMLVEQAALAFEIWTGQPADRVTMRAALD
jgi:shikimate dehydrogenase